jgi:uncharacterized phage protein (TIGR01671 family)
MSMPKFRAWDTKNLRMLMAEDLMYEALAIQPDGSGVAYKHHCSSACDVDRPELIALRSTGLYDKNGAELYEGDIVAGRFDGSKGTAWIVEYMDGAFQFFNIHDSSEGYAWLDGRGDVAVIGNIYNNPEPLEVS